jgi:toxin FitB
VIVLDTNVVSELIRPHPDARVIAWVDLHPVEDLYVAVTTAAELRYGVARLPDGRRARDLASRVEGLLAEDFKDRVLPFTSETSTHYGRLVAGCEKRGHQLSVADAQIAAICLEHDLALATRNIKDFTDTGVDVINPWS